MENLIPGLITINAGVLTAEQTTIFLDWARNEKMRGTEWDTGDPEPTPLEVKEFLEAVLTKSIVDPANRFARQKATKAAAEAAAKMV